MIHVETKSGFVCDIPEERLDDMELVDNLAEVMEGNLLAISGVAKRLLGPDRKRLYDHLRTEDGRVPTEAVMDVLTEIMNAPKDGKN